jgi:hypothetical protein
MALGVVAVVQAIVLHAGFLDRLCHGEIGLTATLEELKVLLR